MREVRGAELRAIMEAKPSEAAAALQAASCEHAITEREPRWSGDLIIAKTGSYELTEHSMADGATGDIATERFSDEVLAGRIGASAMVWCVTSGRK